MKTISKDTKDLLINIAFSLVIAACCVVAYDRFFVPKIPKVYVIDYNKIETDLRRELLALSYNNNGMPIDRDFVVEEVNKIVAFIEKVAAENNALIFNKDNLTADGSNAKNITEQVLKMYVKNLKERTKQEGDKNE